MALSKCVSTEQKKTNNHNQYVSIYYMPGTLLSTKDAATNMESRTKLLALVKLTFRWV